MSQSDEYLSAHLNLTNKQRATLKEATELAQQLAGQNYMLAVSVFDRIMQAHSEVTRHEYMQARERRLQEQSAQINMLAPISAATGGIVAKFIDPGPKAF